MPSFIIAGRNTRTTFARKLQEINDKCKRLDIAILHIELIKMVNEMNDLKVILFLVLYAISMIASTNIDCNSKAFHCVNSTHFMICVDLGGGVSTTIDDFIIPCPPTTECHKYNIFECEFAKNGVTTPPPLEVTGVSKQSDTSVTTLGTYSVTVPTPPNEASSVTKKNMTVTTFPVSEDVISVPKLEVLEDLKKSSEIVSEYNTTETSRVTFVTSSSTKSANEIIENKTNAIRTYASDNSESAVQTSIDKAVTTSLSDKSIATTTSVTGLTDLFFNDTESVQRSQLSPDVLSSLNTLYDSTVTTMAPYLQTSKQRNELGDTINSVKDELNKKNVNVFSEKSAAVDEISTTPMVTTYLQNDSVSTNFAEQTTISEITATERVSETKTKYSSTDKLETQTMTTVNPEIITDNPLDTLGLLDSISNDSQSIASYSSGSNVLMSLNTLNDNTATIINQNINKQVEKTEDENENATDKLTSPKDNLLGKRSVVTDEVITTPLMYYYINFQNNGINNKINSNNQNDSIYQNVGEQKTLNEVTTTVHVPEIHTKHPTFVKTDIVTEPVIIKSTETTTQEYFDTLELISLISHGPKRIARKPSSSYDNSATTITSNLYTTNLITKLDDKIITNEITLTKEVIQNSANNNESRTTSTLSLYKDGGNQNFSVNQNFGERNNVVEMTTPVSIPKTNTNYVAPETVFVTEPSTVVYSQSTSEMSMVSFITEETIISTTKTRSNSDDLFYNDSFVKSNVASPVDEITTAVYRESNEKLIATTNYTSDFSNTTKRQDHKASTADSLNDKTTEPPLFLTTTQNYSTMEITTTDSLQNELIVHKVEIQKELSVTPTVTSGDDNHLSFKTDTSFSTDTTPTSYITTSNIATNTTVRYFKLSPSDNLLNAPVDPDYAISDNGVTRRVTDLANKMGIMNTLDNTERVTVQPNLNNDQWTTITGEVEKTTVHWNNIENSATTIYEFDDDEKTGLSDSVTSINQNYNPADEVLKTFQTPLSNTYPTEFTTYAPDTDPMTSISNKASLNVFEQAPSATTEIKGNNGADKIDFKIETTTFPLTETHHINKDYIILTTLQPQPQTNKDTTISSIDINEKVNETETLKPINGINRHDASPSSAIYDTFKDKSNKTVSLFETTSSPVDLLPNGTLNLLNSTADNLENYMTTAEINTSNKLTKVGENVSKQSEDLLTIYRENTINSELPTNLSPLSEMYSESFKNEISTKAPSSSTTGFDFKNPPITNIDIATEKTTDLMFKKVSNSIKHSKLSNLEPGTTSTISDFTAAGTVDGLTSAPRLDDPTTIATTYFISSTQNTSPPIKPENTEANNINQESQFYSTQVMDTQTNKYDNTQSSPPILLVTETPTRMTAESTFKINKFTQNTMSPIAQTNNDVSSGIRTTELPLITTVKYTSLQSINDTATETITYSVNEPDSMVKTIKVNENIMNGKYDYVDVLFSVPIVNDQTVNKSKSSEKPAIKTDHESIVVEPTSEKNIQNTTKIYKKTVENVNHTENAWAQPDVNIDNVKVSSAEEESAPKASVLKLDMDLQSTVLPSKLPLASEIARKNSKTTDITANTITPTEVTETGSDASKNFAQSKIVINDEIKTTNSNSFTNQILNIKISVVKQVETNFGLELSERNKISNTMTNLTTSSNNLSLKNNTVNNNSEQHLISKNHIMTTEVQSHFNETDKQRNKTSNELKINGSSKHNVNHTSINVNADTKDNTAINVSASPFDCSNLTRGRYADKTDCRTFYTCIGNLRPIIGTCPNNTVFSEINKQCTRNLSHCVRNNQFRCLFEGRFSDFFRDNIYYICVKNSKNTFIRYKLKCQNGYHLHKVSVKCERNEEISSQSSASVSEARINTEESTPATKLEDSTITGSTDFECKEEGRFPHAKDCRKYYVCTKIKNEYRRRIKKCASDEIYDEKKKKCVERDSNEC